VLLPALEPIVSDDEVDEDGVSDVEEPELIVPGALLEVVESEREPAPEPAPEPMLPDVVSRGLEDGGEEDGEDEERLPLDCELLLSVSRELLFDHFENSDCVSSFKRRVRMTCGGGVGPTFAAHAMVGSILRRLRCFAVESKVYAHSLGK
jgi:hypothetical protein